MGSWRVQACDVDSIEAYLTGGADLVSSTNALDSEGSGFLQALLPIVLDPAMQKLALSLAGDPDLAEDALQEVYYAMARVRNPEAIDNLRGYVYTVLANTVRCLRGQLRSAVLVEDMERLAEVNQDVPGCNPASPVAVEETVTMSMTRQIWLERFAALRADLRKTVPGRSDDADRYRDVIVGVAGRVLRAVVDGDVSRADVNQALRARYPEWFGREASAADNEHQRFSRARADVRDLLRCVISRDELHS